LIRSEVLRQTCLQQAYTSSDVVMLCDLALRGRYHVIDEPLFYKRWHGGNLHVEKGPGRMVWSRPELARSGQLTLPYWIQLFGYASTVAKATQLSLGERFKCGISILRWMRFKWKFLIWDLAFACVMAVHSDEWRRTCYAAERWASDESETKKVESERSRWSAWRALGQAIPGRGAFRS